MNPMVRKELQQRMRERRGWILPSAYLLVLGSVVALTYFFATENMLERGLQGSDLGGPIFLVVSYTQLALLLLMAPIYSAASFTLEKEQRTLAGLLTSLLTPWQIWWGKFVSALLFLLLLIFSALPVLSLVFAFGGVGAREVALGLCCSSYFRRSVHATAVTYIVIIALVVVTVIAYALVNAIADPAGAEELQLPYVIPLLMNPFFLITAAFAPPEMMFSNWLMSAGFFLLLGLAAKALTLHNLRRAGEQC